MANEFDASRADLHDHRLKQQRLVFQTTVTANATPADKVHSVDIPSSVILRTEGKTADADAVEDLSAQVPAAADATGIYAILVDIQPSKLYSVSVTGASVTQSGLSTGGRILIEVDSANNLSTTDDTLTIEIEYKE